MAFGDRLAAVRRGNGLTQEQFAEQLQVSRQAVSKWESGRGYPEMEKILYICNRYQVSIADLFAEEAPVPAAAVEARPAPEQEAAPLPRATLGSAVGAFLTNLSPKNKWLAAGVLVGIGALAGIIGLILRGGDTDMATTIWIAAIIIFGVAETATAGLTSIWFVLGSVAGLIAAVCGRAGVAAGGTVLRGVHRGAGLYPAAGGQADEKGYQAHQRRPGTEQCGPRDRAHRQRAALRRRLYRR